MATRKYGIATWADLNSGWDATYPPFIIPEDGNSKQCPTKSELNSCLYSTRYTLAISGTYDNKQTVKYADISVGEKRSQLTIKLTSTPVSAINESALYPIKYSTNTAYTIDTMEKIEYLTTLTTHIDSFTSTSVTITTDWSAYSSAMKIFYAWDTTNETPCVLYGVVTTSTLIQLKQAGNYVTITGGWNTVMSA